MLRKVLLPLKSGFLKGFLKIESASGILMLLSTLLALIAANADWEGYQALISTPFSVGYGMHVLVLPLTTWVKEVLMVFFFWLITMELKREICVGFLSNFDQCLLPFVSAIGGMIMPAILFLLVNRHHPEHLDGWAISSATDIAFALAILSLLGKRIPANLKIFLLAIAIFDDLGAILIVLLFYNAHFAIIPLLWAFLGIAALGLLNFLQVSRIIPYIIVGIFLAYYFHAAGIHTTMAGVAVGATIPMRVARPKNASSPLQAALRWLHPGVNFIILPLFAATSAGIHLLDISLTVFQNTLPLGIIAGLFLGKPLGIFGLSFLLIYTHAAKMPPGVTWNQLYGIATLAGIGFTMSLFIGFLGFEDIYSQELIKAGVLLGSFLSAILGSIILYRANSR